MRFIRRGREPQSNEMGARGPLVDLDMKPPLSQESQSPSKPRRKRLSDMEAETGVQPPEQPPQPRHRRSLTLNKTGAEEPRGQLPSVSVSPGPRSVVGSAVAKEQESTLKPGRSRGAIAPPCDPVPGLQDVINPPQTANDAPDVVPSDEVVLPPPQVDPAQINQWVGELRTQQNFSLALAGGLIAAGVGAIIWALITIATNYQIGWMAVGVGFLVGGTIRTLGRGIDKSFGHLGAALSLFGCLLGNLLSLCAAIAGQEGVSPLAVLAHIGGHPILIPAALLANFHSLDLLFYGIAVYEGYRFSLRKITDTDISQMTRRG